MLRKIIQETREEQAILRVRLKEIQHNASALFGHGNLIRLSEFRKLPFDEGIVIADGIITRKIYEDERQVIFRVRFAPLASLPAHKHECGETVVIEQGAAFDGATPIHTASYIPPFHLHAIQAGKRGCTLLIVFNESLSV